MKGKVRAMEQLRRIEHYSFLRWQKATSREAELFWINAHNRAGEMQLVKKVLPK